MQDSGQRNHENKPGSLGVLAGLFLTLPLSQRVIKYGPLSILQELRPRMPKSPKFNVD
jgi:hypothetical protein